MEKPGKEEETRLCVGAARFEAVKGGKVQEFSLSVTVRDGNCYVYNSFGETPNALSQSHNSSGHWLVGSAVPSLWAMGTRGC